MRLHSPAENKTPVVETLTALMDRLSSPDLTASEAQVLRPQLFRLLETIEAEKSRKSVCQPGRCMAV